MKKEKINKENTPHGGMLVNRLVTGKEKKVLLERAARLPKIHLNAWEVSDLEMIAIGAFSPLTGFMGSEDYSRVIREKRLTSGLPWTVPITLSVAKPEAEKLKAGDEVALVEEDSKITLAILKLSEKFPHDKKMEAKHVFGTTEEAHPGVNYLYGMGEILLAGNVSVIDRPPHNDFLPYRLDPKETRQLFQEKGWHRIVGFQTRNPIHRAHEYLQKCALEIVDGLFLHPLVGETKSDDIPADVRMKCYEVLLENYYPKDRVVTAVLPMSMRYAGPREAILHAIVRKNYGCTHFIVGRDHAGVGKYYGTYDAHFIFDEFAEGELGITPLFFDHAFFCKKCGVMGSTKTCPHDAADHVFLSGTKVREMLSQGQLPPAEFSRPEVAKILMAYYQSMK